MQASQRFLADSRSGQAATLLRGPQLAIAMRASVASSPHQNGPPLPRDDLRLMVAPSATGTYGVLPARAELAWLFIPHARTCQSQLAHPTGLEPKPGHASRVQQTRPPWRDPADGKAAARRHPRSGHRQLGGEAGLQSAGFVEERHCQAPHLLLVEAVAQTLGPILGGGAGGSAVGDVPAVCGGVTAEGPVSGPCGGELVTVNLGEVVRHHQ